METVEANGTDGKNGKVLRKSENFIEDYGFTNTLDISVGAMLLYYLKDLKPEERQEAIQSIVIPTATTATPTAGGGGLSTVLQQTMLQSTIKWNVKQWK